MNFEVAPQEIDPIIAEALAEMNRRGISGKAVTPFLLARIAERSDGRSLAANIEGVVNNAAIAARIADCYARLVT